MTIKVYEYKNCSTCQQALKYLTAKSVTFQSFPIVDQPPTKNELKKMLGFLEARGGSLKNLFNTSGVAYRELKISDKLKAGLSEADAIELLSKNGKLIKRPFVLTGNDGTIGFKKEAWDELLLSL